VRSPFFSGDLLHHLDLEVTLGNELLEPKILLLEILEVLSAPWPVEI